MRNATSPLCHPQPCDAVGSGVRIIYMYIFFLLSNIDAYSVYRFALHTLAHGVFSFYARLH